ncbi:MAG: DUF11 domain-containing protein, partial [Actinomycetes bacterium]
AGSNAATVTITVTAPEPPAEGTADLSVDITDSPDPVGSDGLVTYTLVVTNEGPDPAAGASLLGHLYGYRSVLVAATTSAGSCEVAEAKRRFSCELGTIASGATVTITVEAKASGGSRGWFNLRSVVWSAVQDPEPENNVDSERTASSQWRWLRTPH